MAKIRIAALDGSKRNFGVAKLDLDLDTMELTPVELHLIKTEKSTSKQVRKSSDNLDRSIVISEGLSDLLRDCAAVFVEVPSGGQSHDAVLGFGIVIGLYAGVAGMMGRNLIEVSPSETKLAAVGTRTASKQEMIEWAITKYPAAPWLRAKQNGPKVKKGDPTNDNEHLADAVAIAHAGIRTPAFKTTLALLRSTALIPDASSANAA